MVGVDIVEHECDAVEVLLALLFLLELLVEVSGRLLFFLLLLILFIPYITADYSLRYITSNALNVEVIRIQLTYAACEE